MKNTIDIECSLCGESLTMEVELPEGWATRYDGISEGRGFCPKHQIVSEFADSQCPGCVESWGDCELFKAFAYGKRNRNPLRENDFAQLRLGICPRRTNGTFETNFDGRNFSLEDIRLDQPATSESGVILEQAIKDYLKEYPE